MNRSDWSGLAFIALFAFGPTAAHAVFAIVVNSVDRRRADRDAQAAIEWEREQRRRRQRPAGGNAHRRRATK